jgi:hypothetical protein
LQLRSRPGPCSTDGTARQLGANLKIFDRTAPRAEGNHAPGTLAGVNFSSSFTSADQSPLLNDVDQTAFLATLTGDFVDFTDDQGIWATDGAGTLQLIAQSGGTRPSRSCLPDATT